MLAVTRFVALALAAGSAGAQSIEPFRAQDVQPWQPPQQQQQVRPAAAVQPQPVPPARAPQQAAGTEALLGVWQTNIPGAVYTTPSGRPGYELLHVSSGAAAGLLKLDRNGGYSWNSYGGKRGKWVPTGRADYPIELLDTVENKRWLVGLDPRSGELVVWSGSYWYNGRRAALK